ncbi:MAG: helix-turn-helix transcriptional regulator [Bacteroidales bacterium]|jgi:transcriptional regulator with XRE-family HTH domain|nr:helix-turn-helix transcriptional regulator [Bacteroidales bacterium]
MKIEHTIKRIRELRNYSQEYMAENLGISQVTYSRIETGQTQLNTRRMQQIAKVLEIDLIRLFSFDERVLFNKDKSTKREHINTCNKSCLEETGRIALLFHITQLENELKALKVILGLQESSGV